MERARDLGCDVSGITISRKQAAACQANGLDVRVLSFDEAPKVFGQVEFDVIILNGPTEHFVSQEDAAKGKGEAIIRQLFAAIATMLRPQGVVFITCIHFRWQTNPSEVCRPPLQFPAGSYYFYCSILVDIYSGWYPYDDIYERMANAFGLSLVHSRDATRDYYLTSQQWSRRLKEYLKENLWFTLRFLTRFFIQDPRYFFSAFLFWFYDPWTWQFRSTDSLPTPMIHRWLMFERAAN